MSGKREDAKHQLVVEKSPLVHVDHADGICGGVFPLLVAGS